MKRPRIFRCGAFLHWWRAPEITALAVFGLIFFGDVAGIRSTFSSRDAPVSENAAPSNISKRAAVDHPPTSELPRPTGDDRASPAGNPAVGAPVNDPSIAQAGLASSINSDSDADQLAGLVKFWGLGGPGPEDFVLGIDNQMRTTGLSSATISSLRDTGFTGTLRQVASAEGLRGKRIEFSVDLRTAEVTYGANLFFRASDATGKAVAFDNLFWSYRDVRTRDLIVNRGPTEIPSGPG
jgi:hypothetical protein